MIISEKTLVKICKEEFEKKKIEYNMYSLKEMDCIDYLDKKCETIGFLEGMQFVLDVIVKIKKEDE